MSEKDPYIIDSLDELRRHYGQPAETVTKATLDYLHDHMVDFISRAPFIVISSGSENCLDASPRGGTSGCVHVIDRKSLAIADWPGNNKTETISNIIKSGHCAVLFLVPQLDFFLRIRGTAFVTRDPELRERLSEGSRVPKAAIKINIGSSYFHCGKALKRSGLWNPDTWSYTEEVPSVGRILKDLVDVADKSVEELDELYQHALKEELY